MTTSGIVIDQLTRRDERVAVASLSAAFANYSLFPLLCPNTTQRPRVIEAFCRFLFRSSVRHGGAFGTADCSAVICTWPPGAEWPSRWDSVRAGWLALAWRMGWRASLLLTRLENEFDDARVKHAAEPHWYVPLLGVRPEAQGRGLSRAVLRPVLEAADRDRVPVYLETATEANVAIYQKFGFECRGFSKLTNGLPNWELLRPARAESQATGAT